MADPTIGGFTSEINALTSAMKQMRSEMSKLSGGVGGGSSSMMPNYAATASSNIFYTGTESTGGYAALGVAANKGLLGKLQGTTLGAGVGGLLRGTGAALAGAGFATSLMPGMEKYLVRETGYYQAGVSSMGALTLANLKSSTAAGIGTLSAVGSDATVAAILAGRGMTASIDRTSTYQQTLRGIGNAAKYMNQSNEVAAQSMESLTSGVTSSSLLSRGIFTSDPTKKNAPALKESQIFEQFWQRWITDKSITKSEMQDEIRRGFIGANIDSLDIDAAAKERLKVFLVAHSRDDVTGAAGVIMDITEESSMKAAFEGTSALATGGYTNPMSSAYQISTQETSYVEKFAADYKQGFQDAATAIKSLQDAVAGTTEAAGLFGSELKQIAAFMSTFMGSDIGAGFTSGGWIGMAAGTTALGATAGMGAIENWLNGGGGTSATSGTVGTDPGGAWASVMPGSALQEGGADYGATDPALWGSDSHHGVDFWAPVGTDVYAAYDGTVKPLGNTPNGELGLHIILNHGGGWTTTYAHLSAFMVNEGQSVKKGQVIGKSGNSGKNASGQQVGAHLHFAVAKNGTYVNPNTFTDTIAAGLTGNGGGGTSATLSSSSTSSIGSYSPNVGGSISAASVLGSATGVGTGTTSGSSTVSGVGSNVTINVTIAQASDAEALRLADLVKAQLQQDSFMTNMGAY